MQKDTKSLRVFSLSLIIYTLLVIVWGAWVRISKSGNGCGEHWPLCHGQWIPLQKPIATWIEFSHRLSTGIYGILILILVYWCHRSKNKSAIQSAYITLLFTITEALIGAQLVLKGLVGADASLSRAYWMVIHQINSLLLTASLVFNFETLNPQGIKLVVKKFIFSLFHPVSLVFIFIAGMGALAALSGTLFPSDSLVEGILKDFAKDSHLLVRLRVWHPIMATLLGISLIAYPFWLSFKSENSLQKQYRIQLLILSILAVVVGYSTLLLLSPTALKLTHLALAHILWMAYLRWHLWRLV